MCLHDVDRDNFTFLPLTFRVAAGFRTTDSFLEIIVKPEYHFKQYLYSILPEISLSETSSV
jgi:hypothetical protein